MSTKQLKKFNVIVDYGEGEETESHYFHHELSNSEIEETHLKEEYGYGPTPIIKYIGLVDAIKALGDDYKELEGRFITNKEYIFIMYDIHEDVCPGGQGYDK